MDSSEIAWRIHNLLRDRTDAIRIPLGLVPRFSRFFDPAVPHARSPGFKFSPVDRQQFSDAQTKGYDAAWQDRLLQEAEDLLDNRLSYFNLSRVHHGTPFRWHRDHSAGIDAPVRLSVNTDYRDFATFGDCKLVWEPNRGHQFVVLARAWVVSGDDRFAHKVLELFESWIDANPYGYGMNWKSPLEHGIRIINWVWALDLLSEFEGFEVELQDKIRLTLFRLIWDAQRRYSKGSSANNHLIGEAAGVFIGCCYFPELWSHESWLSEAQDILEREIQSQTFDSGCTREHTFGYQLFVIQFFHHCLLAGENSGHGFSDQYKSRLLQMYEFIGELVADTGTLPAMNDCDDGYVVNLGERPTSPLELASQAAAAFARPDLRLARSETEFWLTGSVGEAATEQSPRSTEAFGDAGYFLLRHSGASILFDAANLGYGSIAAHGHADCLDVKLAVEGTEFLVDSGTYDYFTEPDSRNYFRSTRAHNTAEIDCTSQSEMLGPFLWGKRAVPRIVDWLDTPEQTRVVASHNGYERLEDPVLHTRALELSGNSKHLLVQDRFDCNGGHRIRLHWHFAEGCEVVSADSNQVVISNNGLTLSLRSSELAIEVLEPGGNDPRSWISTSYHSKIPSVCLVNRFEISGSAEVETLISWQ